MKAFYKTFALASAMLATFATNSMADRYHASKVECRVGISSDTEQLEYLGVTADSCEIWGKRKTSDNWAYFWCDIDGASFSIPQTSIKTNTEYSLEELSWNQKMWVRGLPSSNNQSYIVKVKSNKSGENKFVSYTWYADLDSIMSSWHVTGGECHITNITDPVYNSDDDTFTQEITWDYSGIPSVLIQYAQAYVSYDGGIKFQATKDISWRDEGLKRTLTVSVPGDQTNVRYAVALVAQNDLMMVVEDGEWDSAVSKAYELKKPIVSPDSGDSGSSSIKGDGQGTDTGVDKVSENTKNVDIYNVQGERVAKNISLDQAKESLDRGVYIVNNKKVVLGK